MAHFAKPPLSLDAQLELLAQRGLTIQDPNSARHYLAHINYYRLSGYWLPFEANHENHQFVPGTTFQQVLDLYVFDRELRLLVMDALERVEVSVRTGWAYHMAHRHGPHCHLQRELFKPRWYYQRYRDKLEREVSHSQEPFIRHLKHRYNEPLPPIWALVEVMTFGQLSQWYVNTRSGADRNAVAREYGIDERVLCSLMHHLTTVRNTCAHHGRLWNREFTVLPLLPRRGPEALLHSMRRDGDRRMYNTLAMLLFMMNIVNPDHHWRSRLIGLIGRFKVDPSEMGFPENWDTMPLWR